MKLFSARFFILLLFIAGCAQNKSPREGVGLIPTQNYANAKLGYYYYIPSTATDPHTSYPLLVMVPGLSGGGQAFVTPEFKSFAEEQQWVIVAPSFMFDEKNYVTQQSYQFPAAWSGNALFQMIEKIKEEQGMQISTFSFFGFSAGAQFALRFCLWKPELCSACAAHAPGGTILPDKKINVKFFVTVGTQDAERREKVKAFYMAARNYGIPVNYKEYNAGHELTHLQARDSLEFFKGMH